MSAEITPAHVYSILAEMLTSPYGFISEPFNGNLSSIVVDGYIDLVELADKLNGVIE